LVDELASPESVLELAVERAGMLAEKPAGAFAAIKQTLIEVTGHAAPGGDREHLPRFIDHWFTPESEQRRRALLESLRAAK
jgi:hypothetical protein